MTNGHEHSCQITTMPAEMKSAFDNAILLLKSVFSCIVVCEKGLAALSGKSAFDPNRPPRTPNAAAGPSGKTNR
jgi:hypothetical protein